jgi:hypothetical protein
MAQSRRLRSGRKNIGTGTPRGVPADIQFCVNKPYSFQVQTSGGIPLLTYNGAFPGGPNISFGAPGFPLLTGTPTATGTFGGAVNILDSADIEVSAVQIVSLTVVARP